MESESGEDVGDGVSVGKIAVGGAGVTVSAGTDNTDACVGVLSDG